MRYFDCEICDMQASDDEIPQCECRKPMREIFPFSYSAEALKAIVADESKMAELSNRTKKMLSMRAGMDGEPHDFDEISKELGISTIRCIGLFCRDMNKIQQR